MVAGYILKDDKILSGQKPLDICCQNKYNEYRK